MQEEFGATLDSLLDADFYTAVADAERRGIFPREIVTRLGAAGLFADKWSNGHHFRLAELVRLHATLGAAGSGGVGVGVSVHDSALAMLYRFAGSDLLRAVRADATAGTALLCLGASEHTGGSDLQSITSTAVRDGAGYALSGTKAFVSGSAVADYVLILAQCPTRGTDTRPGNLGVFAVPRNDVTVHKPYATLGSAGLDTAPIEFDTWVPEAALLGRPGLGLAILTWGLTHERLTVAAQVSGACDRILGLTVARMQRREQFGSSLYQHQALRLRIADLQARVDLLRFGLRGIVADGQVDIRTAAGLKVTAARLGQEVTDECLHIFGGLGYLTEHSPLAGWWQDMRLSRIGGGTDEVLWELVAAGMKPDFATYDALFKYQGSTDSMDHHLI